MGRLHTINSAALETTTEEGFSIRVPVKMVQLTEKDGFAWPLAFDWQNDDGEIVRVKIDGVRSVTPAAERKNGAVGDRYECDVAGRTEYLYYSKIHPRKWFLIQKVDEMAYNEYYKLPNKA